MSVEGFKNASMQLLFPKPIYLLEGVLLEHIAAFEAEVHTIMNAIPTELNNKNPFLLV